MNFWKSLFFLLIRRKRVGIPAVLLAVAVTAGALIVIPVRYTSSTIMMVSPPVNGGVINRNAANPSGGGNPLLIQTEGLSTAVATLVLALGVEETRAELGAPKDGPTTLVVNDGSTSSRLIGMNGPFVYVEADSTSGDTAATVVGKVRERLIAELDQRQRELGAPRATYVVLLDIVPPTAPEASYTDRILGAAMAFFVTVFLALSAAYGIQRQRRRNRWRKAESKKKQQAAAPQPEPEPEPVSEPVPVPEPVPEQEVDGEVEEDDMPTDSFPAVKAENGVKPASEHAG